MEEIVSFLDVFSGQLSLNDIMNQDLTLLNELREAKGKYNEKINKQLQSKQG